jgi:hypothetical protein
MNQFLLVLIICVLLLGTQIGMVNSASPTTKPTAKPTAAPTAKYVYP